MNDDNKIPQNPEETNCGEQPFMESVENDAKGAETSEVKDAESGVGSEGKEPLAETPVDADNTDVPLKENGTGAQTVEKDDVMDKEGQEPTSVEASHNPSDGSGLKPSTEEATTSPAESANLKPTTEEASTSPAEETTESGICQSESQEPGTSIYSTDGQKEAQDQESKEGTIKDGENNAPQTVKDDLKERGEKVRFFLEQVKKSEDFIEYRSDKKIITSYISKIDMLGEKIQKANIGIEAMRSAVGRAIGDSNLFGRNYYAIPIFHPDDNIEEAREWFATLQRALKLMDKGIRREKDEELGRVPPKGLRACLKNASDQEMVVTILTETPIYYVKTGKGAKTLLPYLRKGANALYLYSKYLLVAGQRLKGILLKVLPLSSYWKDIQDKGKIERLSPDFVPDEFLDSMEELLDVNEGEPTDEYSAAFDADSLKQVGTAMAEFSERLRELDKELYDVANYLSKELESLRKGFYKESLSELYKMYNDVTRLKQDFERSQEAVSENADNKAWKSMLETIKQELTNFFYSLDIIENDSVTPETKWSEDREDLEIVDSFVDDTKPEGLISRIQSIGFHYMEEGKTVYIEKTKVFTYRHS